MVDEAITETNLFQAEVKKYPSPLYLPHDKRCLLIHFNRTEASILAAVKLSEKNFDSAVKKAISRIPEEIRRHLDNMLISVQKRPSRKMIKELNLPPDHPLLGLYVGTAMPERSDIYPPLYPDTIYIFQAPLEEMCETAEQLEEQIEITVVHEIAHFLGISEDRLIELGYE
jgi:predicted Zn-dependent protease with MMP-like domain